MHVNALSRIQLTTIGEISLPSTPGGWILALVLVGAAAIISLLLLLSSRYKRCPSNKILVIYGRTGGGGNTAKCIHGGAEIVWPLIQDYSYMSLEPLQIAIPLKDALSMENIRVSVPSIFTVAIGTEPAVMQNAAIRLLGLDQRAIQQQAQDIIFGQLRQVIASMRIEDINRDRDAFLQNIQKSLEPELRKIGLVLINVNITDITDESGYIQAIGQKAASTAIQQARGDVAEQEKLGEVRVAEALRERAVLVAGATRAKEIGIREAQQAQAVRVAVLDKEQQVGEQTAAFEREVQVKEADRAKRIAVSDANAKAMAGEAKAQAEIVETQAALALKQAAAFQRTETAKKEAEAAVSEAQNRAQAKAAVAYAERIEAEQRAAVEAPARAEKARVIVDAEAEAGKRIALATAEAQAIYLKLEAEARGQYEILAKKGEGLQAIITACGGADKAFQMMLLEHLDHLADASAKAISNIKFDKVVVWENGSSPNGGSGTSNFLQSMARTLPPMLQTMRDIGGIEIPENLIKIGQDGAASQASRQAATVAAASAATHHAPPMGDGSAPRKS